MKINKTSEQCKQYNDNNAESISLGLMDSHEPTDEILAEEKRQAAQAAASFKLASTELEILRQLDPATEGNTCLGVRVEIIETRSRNSYRPSRITGYRLYFGGRYTSSSRWIGIGDKEILGINLKQLEKAKTILNEFVEKEKSRLIFTQKNIEALKRYVALRESDAVLIAQISGASYTLTPPSGFYVLEDSSIKFNSETFTVAQWKEIVALKAAHAKILADLKASFNNKRT